MNEIKALLNKLILSYNGNNKLNFYFDSQKDFFKIKSIKIQNDSIKYQVCSDSPLLSNHYYKLDLKNKKGKKFEFRYSLINDTILVGEFWK